METREWLRYFERNAGEVLRLPPEEYELSAEERARITRSIQGFQLGEASEGKHLREGAEEFAKQTGNAAYPLAIGYLIREENRHSAYLGRFMRRHRLPFAKAKWTDRVFRLIRRGAGIELSLRTLVTAELVALTYYDCLSAATDSGHLALICHRMLQEERKHIEFQMHHIHWMNRQHGPLRATLADFGHAVLMAGTLLAVWIEHRRVLRVKHGFGRFFCRVWDDFRRSMREGLAGVLEDRSRLGELRLA